MVWLDAFDYTSEATVAEPAGPRLIGGVKPVVPLPRGLIPYFVAVFGPPDGDVISTVVEPKAKRRHRGVPEVGPWPRRRKEVRATPYVSDVLERLLHAGPVVDDNKNERLVLSGTEDSVSTNEYKAMKELYRLADAEGIRVVETDSKEIYKLTHGESDVACRKGITIYLNKDLKKTGEGREQYVAAFAHELWAEDGEGLHNSDAAHARAHYSAMQRLGNLGAARASARGMYDLFDFMERKGLRPEDVLKN